MRISELAERAGVSTSTVRYYERIGLVPAPARTASGYRSYDDDAASRLLFVTRAKRLGFSLEEISELLGVWNGTNCGTTHDRVTRLVDDKRAEIVERIAELRQFASQLDEVRDLLSDTPPDTCLPDLSCCVPNTADDSVPVQLASPTRRAAAP
jgi:DNA-binding transcriptional MerR regulator